jgi:potassium-dependent mechanosensitive channel
MRRRVLCWTIAVLVALLSAAAAPAQQTTTAPPADPAAVPAAQAPDAAPPETVESIDKRLTELESSQLDDAAKAKVREYLQETRKELEARVGWEERRTKMAARVDSAPQKLLTQQQLELAANSSPPMLGPPENATLSELESTLAERQAELKRVEELVKTLDNEPQQRSTLKMEIPKTIATLRDDIDKLETQLAGPPDPNESAAMAQARRTLLATRLEARRSQLAALEAELAAYDAEKDLPQRERTYYRERLSQLGESVRKYSEAVNAKWQYVVKKRHEDVVAAEENAPSAVQDEAALNVQYSQEALQLVNKLATAGTQLADLQKELLGWQDDVDRTERRLKKNASESAVMPLRTDRAKANERMITLRREIAARNEETANVQDRLLDLQDRLDLSRDIEAAVKTIRQEKGFQQSPDEEGALVDAARRLMSTRETLLEDLTIRTNQYLETLVELNDSSQELLTKLEVYTSYINERILWLRSDEPVSLATIAQLRRVLTQLARPSYWGQLATVLWDDVRDYYTYSLLFAMVFALLLSDQRRMRRKLRELGDIASRGNCVRFVPTLQALGLTLLICAPWTLLLAFVGWRLAHDPREASMYYVTYWGQGLLGAAAIYFPLEIVRQICRPRALGDSHFNWSDRVLAPLRVNLRWYVICVLPLMIIVAGMLDYRIDEWNSSLGRLAFIALMLLTTLCLHWVVRPQGGALQEYLAYHPEGWVARLTFVWYPLIMLGPAALGILAIAGFYYTAWQLSLRFFYTFLVLLITTFVGFLLHRWLLLSRRRLAIRQARERQQRMQELAEAGGDESTQQPQDTALDLAAINAQTRQLIRASLATSALVAIWLIWTDVLPALAILKTFRVYSVEGAQAGDLIDITLVELGVALLALAMTWIGARNLPGVVEIVLLQRLPLDSSVRYAITTIARYLIALTGLMIVSSTLGFSWRRAQWLVAALGVGLGFGLQEIFANFVSGIILLFERPIRVGDIITLSDVTGVVTRIRIRATTVRDWDGKELIVPNKDLITGRLLNWTLTDTSNRVVITVGVAYGTDVPRARKLILELAAQNETVLKEPPPSVTFESFGDSTLNLVLRAFLPRLDNRLPCINDLHTAIHERFLKEGIEIAFPQMDLHIRDATPFAVQTQPAGAERDGSVRTK